MRMLRMRGASIGLLLLGVLVAVTPAVASHGDHAVIAEVQVGGANAKDEFIEIYNPTTTSIHLEGWRLSKRTGSGAREENLVTSFPALDVAAHASVLVAHPDGAFAGVADQKYTTQSSLANDNTTVLYGPAGSDGQRPIMDLVGFGTATSREGAAVANPDPSQSLERKPGGAEGNGQDTGDNAADFLVQAVPTPQGASAAARPVIAPAEAPADAETAPASEAPAGTGSSPSETEVESEGGASTGSETAPSAPASGTSDATGEIATSPAAPRNDAGSGSSAISDPSPIRTSLPTPTHLRINEFVADPVDGDEWIELVNIGSAPVNLADWIIEDGAETRTLLTGAIGVGEQRFTVIAKPKGQLNNGGDRIVLKNPGGNIVDALTYGDWNDGKASDNAPAASDPASVARVVDGADTDDDRLDFVRTETPTRGTANIVASTPPAEEGSVPRSTSSTPQVLVVLNELFPNPLGDDRADEFLEIANLGTQSVDLAGWRIRDDLGAEYIIGATDGSTGIAAGGFLTLARPRTGIALNDTGGETIRLYKPGQERATSVAEYSGDAAEGVTWARASDGRWGWTTERTPNTTNVIAVPNRRPDAVFAVPSDVEASVVVAFDGSDSADPDREALTFLWNFGDSRTEADIATDAVGRYVYDEPGTYTAVLTVTDARGATATAKRRIVVRAPVVESKDGATPLSVTTAARAGSSSPPTSLARAARPRSTTPRRATSPAVAVALGDLRDAEVGSRVIVRGIVTAPPGSIGKHVFHIADDDGGVEVFVGKRAIPVVAAGDVVEVRGELREVSGGLRVGIATATDVRILRKGTPVEPTVIRAYDASAERIGSLVTIEGEIVEVRGRTVHVDDGSDEIRVALPANAAETAEAMRKGDTIRVAGIMSRTSAGYRVLARSAADVVAVVRAAPPTPERAMPSMAPIRNDLEFAMLGGGGSALLASSLWRRRRIVALAFTATRKMLSFRRRLV
ncbi:MAG: lamin tail domain-containing protein [bacterium]|nr:lamin tail domain-containing protein [bacterium]